MVVITFLLNKMFAKAERAIVGRMTIPQPIGQEYIDVRMIKLINDKTPAAAVVADTTGKIIWVNDWASHILHWRKDEMLGRGFDILLPENVRPAYNKALEEYKRTGYLDLFGKPLRFECLSKGERPLPCEMLIVEAQDDNRVLFIVKIRDITKQLEETKSMQQKIELYEKIEKLNASGGFIWDFINDNVFMTPGMLELFDLDESDNNCSSSITTGKLDNKDINHVADVISNAVNNKRGGYEMEFTLKNGRHLYCTAEIHRNKNENPTFIYGGVKEINKPL